MSDHCKEEVKPMNRGSRVWSGRVATCLAIVLTAAGCERSRPSRIVKMVETAGAGDAFCAGVLYGLHEDWALDKCLMTGVCTAAASLADPTCTEGMKDLGTCLGLAKKYRPRPKLEPEE